MTATNPTRISHRTPIALLTFLLLPLADGARAQEEPLRSRLEGPGRLSDAELIELEVVSVERRDWTVVARDVSGGATFRFKMPPRVFQGQRFTADFSTARPGQKVSVRGVPESQIDDLVVEAALGEAEAPGTRRGGAGSEPGTEMRGAPGDRRPRPGTDRPDGGGPADYVAGGGGPADYLGGGEGAAGGGPADYAGRGTRPGGGPGQYEVLSVDAQRWVATARGPGGTVEIEIDPDAFVGYRFKAPVRGLKRGEGFALLALNQKPIEACCKLVGGGR